MGKKTTRGNRCLPPHELTARETALTLLFRAIRIISWGIIATERIGGVAAKQVCPAERATWRGPVGVIGGAATGPKGARRASRAQGEPTAVLFV